MITLNKTGFYKLIETRRNIKILYLDNDVFAWIEVRPYGEILVTSRKTHKTDCILGLGHFNLYKVIDEPELSDHFHLELEVGRDVWQGYLLLSGLPNLRKKRGRIIPTDETITGSHGYKPRKEVKSSLVKVTQQNKEDT